jgi:hypothetical protein
MDANFASQRNTLDDSFQTTLNEMMSIYGDSKTKDDDRVDVKKEELRNILDQMSALRDDILREIRETNSAILVSASRAKKMEALKDDLKESNTANMVLTADQQMNDAKSLFDHHRILLLVKVGIVLLILIKGNEIYESYRLVFAGASLACIFVYMMFVFFF